MSTFTREDLDPPLREVFDKWANEQFAKFPTEDVGIGPCPREPGNTLVKDGKFIFWPSHGGGPIYGRMR